MDLIITILVFGCIFGIASAFILRRESGHERARETLRRVTSSGDAPEAPAKNRRPSQRTALLATLYRLDLLRKLEDDLWRAGIYARVTDVLLIIVLLFGAGIAAGQILFGGGLLSLMAGVALGALPIVYIQVRKQRRLRAFVLQLPYALDLLKSSLEAGHSLMRGMQVVVQEFPDPLGGEFRTVLEQTRIGLPLPRALQDMLTRVPEEDLRLLVVAVKVQSEVGSSLAQIIGRLSEIVRTRQRLQNQIKAMTAQSRMGGMIVGILPLALMAFFGATQPAYTHTLFHTASGIKLVKIALTLDVVAFIMIRRLLRSTY
ncbi:MAG: type II secretion system F family protein [Candidatus Binataceae bacterium]